MAGRAGRTLPVDRVARFDEIVDFTVFLLSDRGVVTGSVLDRDQNVFDAHD